MPVKFLFLLISAISSILPDKQGELILHASTDATTVDYRMLLLSNDSLLRNDSMAEYITSTFHFYMRDSLLSKKKERHRFAGGFLLNWMGLNWRSVSPVKKSITGQLLYDHVHDNPITTEYDATFNLNSYLGHSRYLVWEAFSKQKKIGRGKRKLNYADPRFLSPAGSGFDREYKLHCELTVPEDYREAINEKFYPCESKSRYANHPQFMRENPVVGIYGSICVDCNHLCHPEMHPYEGFWHLKTMGEEANTKSWLWMMSAEGSNRFPHWSSGQPTAAVSIPFVFTDSSDYTIDANVVLSSLYLQTELKSFVEQISNKHFAKEGVHLIHIPNADKEIKLNFQAIADNALYFWFSELNYDEHRKLLSGRLHLSMQVDPIIAWKVSFH